jgi:hypothetical protein
MMPALLIIIIPIIILLVGGVLFDSRRRRRRPGLNSHNASLGGQSPSEAAGTDAARGWFGKDYNAGR